MMNVEPVTLYMLILANLLFASAAALAVARVERLTRESLRSVREPADCAALERRLAALESAWGERPPRQAVPERAPSPYEQAAQLASDGASAGELAERLGLSRGEAELIARLHRPPGPTAFRRTPRPEHRAVA